MENQEYENVIENQTDVSIGEEETVSQPQDNFLRTDDCEAKAEEAFEEFNEELEQVAEDNISESQIEEDSEEIESEQKICDKPIGVYVKYDESGNIKEVNSDIFIDNLDGWTKIDEGYGDRFAHAQSQYFENKE